jgi:Base plate wedge protein 53
MSKYFSLFPKIPYDIAGEQYSTFQNVTNIFFRLRIIRETLSNISSYHYYLLHEDETPEILAEKHYGDPEAHWIILLANDIVDPQYDWYMSDRQFRKYIIGKYGSIAAAKTTIHHYEKVITREDQATNTVSETRFVINKEKLTNNSLDVPYDYYQGTGSLPETQSVATFNLSDGKTVVEIIRRDDITNWDYELAKNEERRTIKLIKQEYYGQILKEFQTLTNNSYASYFRKFA